MLYSLLLHKWLRLSTCRGIRLWCEFVGDLPVIGRVSLDADDPSFTCHLVLLCFVACHYRKLLDVLNAHFQQVFGITKLQSTMLQLAYFVRTLRS